MRRRLVVTFIVLGILLGGVGYLVRTMSVADTVRETESSSLSSRASVVATAIRQRAALRRPVTPAYVRNLVDPANKAIVERDGHRPLVVDGTRYEGPKTLDRPEKSELWASGAHKGVHVMLIRDDDAFHEMLVAEPRSLVALVIGLLLAMAGLGCLFARTLTAPFQRLAQAADGLGRGRFQLDLPVTNIPEAVDIASALRTSAERVERRLGEGRALAEHTSHALRTPLTGLRLELDDLAQQSDLPLDVRAAVARCVSRIDQLDVVTGELVGLARQGSIAAGAEITLRELAGQTGRRWESELDHQDRILDVRAAGDLDARYTPGPIEQILELLLVDVLHRSRGSVELMFHSTDSALSVRVEAGEPAKDRGRGRSAGTPLVRARAVATALGGRVEGERPDAGVTVRLPRR